MKKTLIHFSYHWEVEKPFPKHILDIYLQFLCQKKNWIIYMYREKKFKPISLTSQINDSLIE